VRFSNPKVFRTEWRSTWIISNGWLRAGPRGHEKISGSRRVSCVLLAKVSELQRKRRSLTSLQNAKDKWALATTASPRPRDSVAPLFRFGDWETNVWDTWRG